MIVLVLTAIGVATAVLSWTRIKRLAGLHLDGLWLVWSAILLQIVVFEMLGRHLPLWASNALHLFTYTLCVGFLWRNRWVPGGWVITFGTACNLIVISVNGGTMPADSAAWKRAGLPNSIPMCSRTRGPSPRHVWRFSAMCSRFLPDGRSPMCSVSVTC